MNEILRAIEAEQIRTDLPEFHVGDNVKLHVKVKEGNRERIQMFEGTVIKRQNGGLRETFTVRRLAYGVGVERTFPVNSPIIEKMEGEMAGNGRILVRPSGTEPLLRVMAEAPTTEKVNYYVDTIATVVKDEIGID